MNGMSVELREKDAGLREAVRAVDRQNAELRLQGRDLERLAHEILSGPLPSVG